MRTAHSGEAGLKLCEQEVPDLILLDLRLPGITGLEALRRIKGMDRTCRVVMMTAYQSTQSVVEAMKLGAEDYLTKPVAVQDLLGVVARLVGPSAQEDPAQGKGLEDIVYEGGGRRPPDTPLYAG